MALLIQRKKKAACLLCRLWSWVGGGVVVAMEKRDVSRGLGKQCNSS